MQCTLCASAHFETFSWAFVLECDVSSCSQQQLCLQKQQHPVSVGLLDVATGSSSLSRTGHSPLNALAAAQATIGFYLSDTNSIDSFPQTCGWNNEMDAVLEDWRDPMQGRDWESEDGMSGGWQPPRQSSVAYGCVGVEEEPNVGINLTGGGFVSGGLQRSRQVCTDGGKGCVVGGGPSASPQFQKGVNSRAKWAVGQDGTAWFLTGDGWAHNAAGVRRRVSVLALSCDTQTKI